MGALALTLCACGADQPNPAATPSTVPSASQSESGGQTSDGGELIDYAAQEQEQNARPALTTHIENLADYDTIFLGCPIWWGSAAWPVNDFVKNNDFTGKTVTPFCASIPGCPPRRQGVFINSIDSAPFSANYIGETLI